MSTAAGALDAERVEHVSQPPTDEQKESDGGYRLGWTEYTIVAVIAMVVAVAVFVAGWLLLGKPGTAKVGVLDLPAIVEIEELSLTASMMGSQVTDEDRAQAYERVKAFGPRLEAAIDQARKECGCILLTRNAIVGQSGADQTLRVKQILGVASLNAAELRERIAKNLQAIPEVSKR